MLEEYRAHTKERYEMGIPPKPLNAEQVAGLVELLKSPPAGEEAYLLTLITFGIYGAWFQVKLIKFNADHTKFNVEGKRLGMRFTGEGGELFVIIVVGYLLSLVTFGIYSFWMMAKLLKWQVSNLVVMNEGGAPMAMGAPAMGVQQIGGPPPQQMGMGAPQPALGGPAPMPGNYGGPPPGPPGGPPQGYA